MGNFRILATTTTLSVLLFSSCSCLGDKSESELIASMREIQLPSPGAVDIYASHSPTHSRFRSPRAVKFIDDGPGGVAHGKKSEAVSASFTVGPSGLSGSLSAAQADGEKTKGYFGAYPGIAGGNGYYPPPPPIYGGGGGLGYPYPGGFGGGPLLHSGGGSSSSAAASSASGGGGGFGGRPHFGGGGPIVPILGGPVTHAGGGGASSSSAAAGGGGGSVVDGFGGGDGYYPGGTGFIGGGGGPGFYPGGGYGAGGYYPGQGQGFYPGSGVGGGYYGYPGAYPGGGGYYRPNYVGGVAPIGGLYGGGIGGGPGYLPSTSGPGFYGGGPGYYGGGYGYGGFRKGEGQGEGENGKLGDKEKYNLPGSDRDLNKNYNSGFGTSSKNKPSGGGVIFKDN